MLQDLLQLWIWKRSIYKKMQKLSWNLIIHEFYFASSVDAKLPLFSESDCVLSSLNWHTKEYYKETLSLYSLYCVLSGKKTTPFSHCCFCKFWTFLKADVLFVCTKLLIPFMPQKNMSNGLALSVSAKRVKSRGHLLLVLCRGG